MWECTCGSPAATPSFPPPLPLPSPSSCSSVMPPPQLAARALMSGTSAGADWADASSRIRLPSLALQLLWQQGKQPPGGRGAKLSAAPGSCLPLNHRRDRFGGSSQPPSSQVLPVPRTRCLALDLPQSSSSHTRQLPPQVTATSHIKLEAKLSCLVTNPQVPSLLFTPACEGGD